MTNLFQKAVKSKAKLRLAITGTSGAGKTYTSLSIASGMSDKIALIDTEFGSASKYAGIFDFDTCNLEKPTIDAYCDLIKVAGENYDVVVIDSLSHAWDELLDQVEKIAKAKYNGNTFRAWSEGTPLQKKLINTILTCPAHVICTMRVKSEYVVDKNDRGKTEIRKVGLSPRQREGMEYEFDMLMEGNDEHYFRISKDRTGKFQDQIIEKPNKEFGKELINWLNDAPEIDVNSIDDLDKLKLMYKQAQTRGDKELMDKITIRGKELNNKNEEKDQNTENNQDA